MQALVLPVQMLRWEVHSKVPMDKREHLATLLGEAPGLVGRGLTASISMHFWVWIRWTLAFSAVVTDLRPPSWVTDQIRATDCKIWWLLLRKS